MLWGPGGWRGREATLRRLLVRRWTVGIWLRVLKAVLPRGLLARYEIPGAIVVAVADPTISDHLSAGLTQMARRSGLTVTPLGPPPKGGWGEEVSEQPKRTFWRRRARYRPDGTPIAPAYEVTVGRGWEGVTIRELALEVARSLESVDPDLEGVPATYLLAIVRSRVAMHPARRSRPAAVPTGGAPLATTAADPERAVAVDLEELEKWLGRAHAGPGEKRVGVVVLDSEIDLARLAPDLAQRISRSAEPPPLRFKSHGAAMASLVAAVAPSAAVRYWPVFGGRVPETEAINALLGTSEPIVLMSLRFTFAPWRMHRDLTAIERVMRARSDLRWTMVIAASGNNRLRQRMSFPGRAPSAVAVGALSDDLAHEGYSAFRTHKTVPRAHFVGPGGAAVEDRSLVRAGRKRIFGTSVAAAWAAGIVARTVAADPRWLDRPVDDLVQALRDAADTTFPAYRIEECGSGLVRQLAPGAAARPVVVPPAAAGRAAGS